VRHTSADQSGLGESGAGHTGESGCDERPEYAGSVLHVKITHQTVFTRLLASWPTPELGAAPSPVGRSSNPMECCARDAGNSHRNGQRQTCRADSRNRFGIALFTG
jgi:hypothetical protein